jgi:trehalose 6-phosphate phosphatase
MPQFSRDWALFLDVDGTLIDIAGHPDAVVVEPAIVDRLEALHECCGGAVALISGRSIAVLERLFPSLHLPMAGQHGAERRDAAGNMAYSIAGSTGLARAKARLQRFVNSNPGLVLEDKGQSVALHYRQAPTLDGAATYLAERLVHELGSGYRLRRGKMVIEIGPSGMDKGSAITAFLATPPFRCRLPVFIGDDVTDEDGFHVVNKASGHSIKVGPGPTEARYRLPDARAVSEWLGRYLDWITQS